MRTLTTLDSHWEFDEARRMYRRRPYLWPRRRRPSSTVKYTCEWEPYLRIEEWGDDGRLLVIRPVPFGYGQLRQTGAPIVRGTVLTP